MSSISSSTYGQGGDMAPLRWACPLGCGNGFMNIPQTMEHLKKTHRQLKKNSSAVTPKTLSAEKLDGLRAMVQQQRLQANGTKARLIYQLLNPGTDILEAPVYAPTFEQVFSSATAVAKAHPRSTALSSKFKKLAMDDSWFDGLSSNTQDIALRVTCALMPAFYKAVTIMGTVAIPSSPEPFSIPDFELELSPPVVSDECPSCVCGRLFPNKPTSSDPSDLLESNMVSESNIRPDTGPDRRTATPRNATKRQANSVFEGPSTKRHVPDGEIDDTSLYPSDDGGIICPRIIDIPDNSENSNASGNSSPTRTPTAASRAPWSLETLTDVDKRLTGWMTGEPLTLTPDINPRASKSSNSSMSRGDTTINPQSLFSMLPETESSSTFEAANHNAGNAGELDNQCLAGIGYLFGQ